MLPRVGQTRPSSGAGSADSQVGPRNLLRSTYTDALVDEPFVEPLEALALELMPAAICA